MHLQFMNPKRLGSLGVLTLQRVFDTATDVYGIKELPGTVQLRMIKPEVQLFETEEAFGLKITEGRTMNVLHPGNIVKMELGIPVLDGGVDRVIHAFLHELAHAAATFLGRLSAAQPYGSGKVWDEKVYSPAEQEKIGYDDLPWELDAEAQAQKAKPIVEEAINAFVKSPEGENAYRKALLEEVIQSPADSTH